MSYDKAVQAKHVPERAILERMKWFADMYRNDYSGAERYEYAWMSHWPVRDWMSTEEQRAWTLASDPLIAPFPTKVLLAKLASMKSRGLVDGCSCGCRGDWHLRPQGLAVLAELGHGHGHDRSTDSRIDE